MKDMLDAVDHRGPIGALENVHDALETENILAAVLGERFEEKRERDGPDRLFAHDRVSLNVGIMPRIHTVVGLFREPCMDVHRFGARIIETRIKDQV